jgi:alanine dehydrogenase
MAGREAKRTAANGRNTKRARRVAGTNAALMALGIVPGASAPKLVTRKMLGTMKRGSVIVDVAIDQGGCTETSRPTTHSQPTYIVDGIVHYCVANMPGGVAPTSTFALNNVTSHFS